MCSYIHESISSEDPSKKKIGEREIKKVGEKAWYGLGPSGTWVIMYPPER